MATGSKVPFGGAYQGTKVLVTGHTGFKGSWLVAWLRELGAEVAGYSLPPPTEPNCFEAAGLGARLAHQTGDVRDFAALRAALLSARPRVVFHLAAQALLPRSFLNPLETFEVNAGGTVNVLEAARTAGSVEALVVVTSDKCYEDRGGGKRYREEDRLGGDDPYSASKGMAELAVAAYRLSFFVQGGEHPALGVASARAGNVIGGGDYGEGRLVPDCVRAAAAGKPVVLRNPESVRPWQFVLEPLSGYLLLGARLLENKEAFSGPWNFGPASSGEVTAARLAEKVMAVLGGRSWKVAEGAKPFHETQILRLSSEKAERLLKWRTLFDLDQALEHTLHWYREFHRGAGKEALYRLMAGQIGAYVDAAGRAKRDWVQ